MDLNTGENGETAEKISSFGKAYVADTECFTLFQRLPHGAGNPYSGQSAIEQVHPHHHADQR